MNAHGAATLGLFLAVLLGLAWPLGRFIAKVYQGERTFLSGLLGPLERGLLRACGARADGDMTWKEYALSLLAFNFAGMIAVYALERLQAWLPLNPGGLPAVSPDIAWNTAASFVSNTNWQAYAGESTMSHLTQMAALTVQNFVSAATGMAVLMALIRGFVREEQRGVGSFWVDLVRGTVYVLLPLSVLFALFLVSQGVVQTFAGSAEVTLLEGAGKHQVLALGPAASQVAIKQLGTNGGGFFNANAAHPFENATPLSNFVQVVSILLVPAALCSTFGEMVKDRRQGLVLLSAMLVIFVPLTVAVIAAEQGGNHALADLGVDQGASALAGGGNMEGKEVRFGAVDSALWASVTTAASNGSVSSMHDSFTPLGGMVPMWLMQLGEIVFGGVGSGLYGMLVYAVIAVFIAGLMVGRTPEYLGKKVEAFEMKMASLVILVPAAAVLVGTALATQVPSAQSAVANPGAHGFSELLYAFSSGANNNGSAFAGLNASGRFLAVAIGVCMLVGRFWVIVPVLAMAGSLAKKKRIPESAGTLPTHTPLFVVLLVGTILLVGALTFVPALSLGPVVEQVSQ